MNTPKKLFYSSLIMFTVGVTVMTPYVNMYLDRQAALAASPQVIVHKQLPQKPTLVTGKPVRIAIPSLGLDLDVIDGTYNTRTGAWTLTKDKAQFATPSTQPNNEEGNTLIYGHYRREVFASLHTIQPGAQAIVTTDNGYQFTYTFTESETVDPSNVDIFNYEGAPRLTVQTCTGAFFEHRQFFYFKYDGFKKLPATQPSI
jgi:LPXTG-site transpeptidase (sortase) family protein